MLLKKNLIQNGKVKVDQTIVNINSMKKRVGTNRGGVECEQKFLKKFINSPQKNKILNSNLMILILIHISVGFPFLFNTSRYYFQIKRSTI